MHKYRIILSLIGLCYLLAGIGSIIIAAQNTEYVCGTSIPLKVSLYIISSLCFCSFVLFAILSIFFIRIFVCIIAPFILALQVTRFVIANIALWKCIDFNVQFNAMLWRTNLFFIPFEIVILLIIDISICCLKNPFRNFS